MKSIAKTAALAAALTAFQAQAAEPTIAVFTKNFTNPAYEAFRLAADQVAKANGARVIHYVPKKPDDVEEQKAFVAQVLKDKPDVAIFIPVDDVAMIDDVKKMNEANIPIVLASNPLPGSVITYVGADDFLIGYREALYLFDKMDHSGKIVVIEGTPKAPTNRERMRGYKKALAENPGIQVLGWEIGNYQAADAKAAMVKLLKEHPQIDALLSASDNMALAALEATKEAGRSMTVISINGLLPAVKKVESGEMLATVDFNMFKIGCTAARAAVRALKKEPLPDKVILPAEVIDKTNYKAWLTPVEQRTCPDWAEVAK
jgi:ribose transport system substrate-binding protein